MPLFKSKSKKAFQHNLKEELHAGKPEKQSLAIAYAMKKRGKKMAGGGGYFAEGGMTDAGYQSTCDEHCTSPCAVHEQAEYNPEHEGDDHKHNSMALSEDDRDLNEHGDVEEGPQGSASRMLSKSRDLMAPEASSEEQDDSHEEDMVGRIMKMRQQAFSKGGMVANEAESNRDTDYLATDDDLEFNYTGSNSGDMLGDAREDQDRKDIVARIMASRRKKDRLPNPR
jgi:hypothetical protein